MRFHLKACWNVSEKHTVVGFVCFLPTRTESFRELFFKVSFRNLELDPLFASFQLDYLSLMIICQIKLNLFKALSALVFVQSPVIYLFSFQILIFNFFIDHEHPEINFLLSHIYSKALLQFAVWVRKIWGEGSEVCKPLIPKSRESQDILFS